MRTVDGDEERIITSGWGKKGFYIRKGSSSSIDSSVSSMIDGGVITTVMASGNTFRSLEPMRVPGALQLGATVISVKACLL